MIDPERHLSIIITPMSNHGRFCWRSLANSRRNQEIEKEETGKEEDKCTGSDSYRTFDFFLSHIQLEENHKDHDNICEKGKPYWNWKNANEKYILKIKTNLCKCALSNSAKSRIRDIPVQKYWVALLKWVILITVVNVYHFKIAIISCFFQLDVLAPVRKLSRKAAPRKANATTRLATEDWVTMRARSNGDVPEWMIRQEDGSSHDSLNPNPKRM